MSFLTRCLPVVLVALHLAGCSAEAHGESPKVTRATAPAPVAPEQRMRGAYYPGKQKAAPEAPSPPDTTDAWMTAAAGGFAVFAITGGFVFVTIGRIQRRRASGVQKA